MVGCCLHWLVTLGETGYMKWCPRNLTITRCQLGHLESCKWWHSNLTLRRLVVLFVARWFLGAFLSQFFLGASRSPRFGACKRAWKDVTRVKCVGGGAHSTQSWSGPLNHCKEIALQSLTHVSVVANDWHANHNGRWICLGHAPGFGAFCMHVIHSRGWGGVGEWDILNNGLWTLPQYRFCSLDHGTTKPHPVLIGRRQEALLRRWKARRRWETLLWALKFHRPSSRHAIRGRLHVRHSGRGMRNNANASQPCLPIRSLRHYKWTINEMNYKW